MELVKLGDVNSRIITVRNEKVILDSDVAALYGVETREVNQAIKNNPDKFPEGYIFRLEKEEHANLISKNLISSCGEYEQDNLKSKKSISSWGGSRKLPNAFTKKGCYMLATILKSPQATHTTIAIIEAFEKMHDMSQAIIELMQDHGNAQKQRRAVEMGESLFGEIIDKAMETVGTETSFELNLAALKIKHTVKRSKKPE